MKILDLIYEELKKQTVYLSVIAGAAQKTTEGSAEMKKVMEPLMKQFADNPLLKAMMKQSEGEK